MHLQMLLSVKKLNYQRKMTRQQICTIQFGNRVSWSIFIFELTYVKEILGYGLFTTV